jgi:phosphate transport system protein
MLRHFAEELDDLRNRLLEMSGLVEDAVYRSVLILLERNAAHASQVQLNEARINQMQIEIDDKATRLLALQTPVATDLRAIMAAIKINHDLERMGDIAVRIAERAVSLLSEEMVGEALIDIPQLAKLAQSRVRQSMDSFVKGDAKMARGVLASDDDVDDLRDAIYEALIGFMQADPRNVRPGISLMFVARSLERLADHATNIAEDVLFLVEGVDVRHHAEIRHDS